MVDSSLSIKSKTSLTSLYQAIDISIILVSFFVALILNGSKFELSSAILLTTATTVFLFFSESIGLYRTLQVDRLAEPVMMLFTVLLLSSLFIISGLYFIGDSNLFSRIFMLYWFVIAFALMAFWRYFQRLVKRRRFRQGKSLKKVAIIGLTESGIALHSQFGDLDESGLKFIGFFDDRAQRLKKEGEVNPDMARFLREIKGNVCDALMLAQRGGVDSIYICLPRKAEERIIHFIKMLGDSTVDVYFVPDLFLKTIIHGNLGSVGTVDTISVFERPFNGAEEFYKRAFDILFSLAVLILLLPVFGAIALAIKFTSRGPVFFRQDRYGIDGQKIKVHKFRSMSVMENDTVTQATKNDKRVTRIGAFLRRTSLDELPQFIDVLRGDMSVVGPRPHAVAHNEEYRKQVDYYMLRHKVKPGITGWAQINGWRGETDTLEKMEKRIEYDLQYIRNWSLWWDVKIVILTVFKGFTGKNAY